MFVIRLISIFLVMTNIACGESTGVFHVNGVETKLYSGPDMLTNEELSSVWNSLVCYIKSSHETPWIDELRNNGNEEWEFAGKELVRFSPDAVDLSYIGIKYERGTVGLIVYENQIALNLVIRNSEATSYRTLFMVKDGGGNYTIKDDLSDMRKNVLEQGE